MYSPGIERALHVAVAAHDERGRSGIVSVDRSVHPLHVALMLARWGQDEDVIVAGLMHGVAVTCGGWDMHGGGKEFTMADGIGSLTPAVDKAVSAFIEDVQQKAAEFPGCGEAPAEGLLHDSADESLLARRSVQMHPPQAQQDR